MCIIALPRLFFTPLIWGKFNVVLSVIFPTNQPTFPLFSAKFLSILWLDRIWPFVRTIARGISLLPSPDDVKTAILSFRSCLLTFYTRRLILLAPYASCAEAAWLLCCEKRAAEVDSQRGSKESSAVCLSGDKNIWTSVLINSLKNSAEMIRELQKIGELFRPDEFKQSYSLMRIDS